MRLKAKKKRNPRAHRIGAIVASGGMAHQGPGSIAIIEDENLGEAPGSHGDELNRIIKRGG